MPHVDMAFTTKRAKPNESPVALAARERLEAAATQSEYLKPIIPAYGGADVVSPPTVLQRDIESMNTVRVHYPKGGYDSVGVPPDKPVDFEVKAHVEYRDRVHCHHVGGPPLPKDAWRVCLSDGTRINRRLTFEDLCPERGALDVYLSSEQSGGSETASDEDFTDSDSVMPRNINHTTVEQLAQGLAQALSSNQAQKLAERIVAERCANGHFRDYDNLRSRVGGAWAASWPTRRRQLPHTEKVLSALRAIDDAGSHRGSCDRRDRCLHQSCFCSSRPFQLRGRLYRLRLSGCSWRHRSRPVDRRRR